MLQHELVQLFQFRLSGLNMRYLMALRAVESATAFRGRKLFMATMQAFWFHKSAADFGHLLLSRRHSRSAALAVVNGRDAYRELG